MSRKFSKSAAGTLCALLVGAAMIATVAPALAHDDTSSSAGSAVNMVYKARKAKFVGTVSSANDKCVGGRTVKLFKARTGKLAGKTTTAAGGGWSISAPKNSGKYFSKVVAADYTLNTGQDSYGNVWVHDLFCNSDKSGVVTTNS